MANRTYGDEESIKCPLCGHSHCFRDRVYEGWEGGDYACDGCGEPLLIEVEMSYSFEVSAVAS
jgi:transcription elongation factor Elf1